MTIKPSPKLFPPLSLLFVIALGLSACAALVSPQPTIVVDTTPVAEVTASTSAPLVLLVAPPQSDPALAAAASELAGAFAAQQGMRFEKRELLDPAQLSPELAFLLLLTPDPGALTLAAAAPQARIITIGFAPESPPPNITALPLGGGQDRSAAFIAGYLAALTAEDWRAGMLYSPASASLAIDFVAGAEFFCGACIPISPPNVELPMISQAADSQNWLTAAEQLVAAQIQVAFLSAELEASGAGQYLAGFGILLIGSGAPPPDLAASWLASISSDPVSALRQQLPLALSGQSVDSSGTLQLSYVNSTYLSEARLNHLGELISDLLAGYIQLPAVE